MKTDICESEIKYYLSHLISINKTLHDYWVSFFFDKQNNKIKIRWSPYNLNQLKENISLHHKFVTLKSKQQ